MHDSVMKFAKDYLSLQEVYGRSVLEVGSRNVNGGVRDWITRNLQPGTYIGVDMEPGPGVDLVLKAEELGSGKGVELNSRLLTTFDVVISTEMLEHCEDWRKAVSSMKRMVHPEGILIVTTRAPGFPRHEHPNDFWRFSVADFIKIFSDMHIVCVQSDPQPGHPGVFLKARPKPGTCDAVDLSKIEVMKAPEA